MGTMQNALRVAGWCFIAMAMVGLAAAVTMRPLIFPSLGPTAMMQFTNPLDPNASPRHVLIGHFVGAAAGYAALALTGLVGVPLSAEIGLPRVVAAAIALALTSCLLILLKAEHPPAGATTLIVALGILPRVEDILFLMAAVLALTVLAFLLNRAARIPYPVWQSIPE
jgi:CBS domain-containing membrane protein